MGPSKTTRPGPSSEDAPPVRPRAKVSRRPPARPVASSRAQSKAAIRADASGEASGEEFELEDEGSNEEPEGGPPSPSHELESQGTNYELVDLKITGNTNSALDILYFYEGVNCKKGEKPSRKICKLCAKEYGVENIPRGVPNFIYGPKTATSNLRRHLYSFHPDEYDAAVERYQWPRLLTSQLAQAPANNDLNQRDPTIPSFSRDAFVEQIVRFVVADDQSIRVVECPEFRRLCMFLREGLLDNDIPRRDRIREGVIQQWRVSFEQLKQDLSKSCGKISFTADAWSNANLQAYLALTAHWISSDESTGRLSLRSALVGFHRLKKKHTGVNIADAILNLLDRADIGHFTLDNAENNAVAMRELGSRLAKRENQASDRFHHKKHRVRCFAHIINICSSHIISSMTSVSEQYLPNLNIPLDSNPSICLDDELEDDDVTDDDDITDLSLDGRYHDGGSSELKQFFARVKRDPLRRARRVIRLIRSSDQRREGFQDFIKLGNEHGWFDVPQVQPLRDVKTRWDSVYAMLERLLDLRPAIDRYIDLHLNGFSHWKLSDDDWDVLEALESVLRIPHDCYQSMSSESTPVLSRTISRFEKFMTAWENLGQDYEILRPWTEIGLTWAKKYYIRMDDTDAYIITMFLDPHIRFTWMEDQWEDEYIRHAKSVILGLMRRHRKSTTTETTPAAPQVRPVPVPVTKRSATRFTIRINSVENRRESPPNTFTVESEYAKYVSGPISAKETDILRFWEANKLEYPTLYSIAMDYLPVQATSVPCERVFSSAKDTDTMKRNRISPPLMEALQLLKYSLKKERLDFFVGLPSSAALSTPMGDLASLFDNDKDPDVALDDLLRLIKEQDAYEP